MNRATHTVERASASLLAVVDGDPDLPWLTCLHTLATDHRLWDDQVAALSARFRLLRIDMRGHGQSTTGNAPPDFATLIADLVAIWDAVGVARSAVIGMSIGGMIAFGLTLTHPHRVDRIVAAACRADAPPAFRATWDQRDAVLSAGGMAAVAEVTLPTWLTASTSADPDLIARVRTMILATSPTGYLAATAALRGLDYRARLLAIAVPLMLIVGAEDGVVPVAATELAGKIPGARLALIDGASHLINFDRPAQFLAATLPFLTRQGA